jgi:hypothetical protein
MSNTLPSPQIAREILDKTSSHSGETKKKSETLKKSFSRSFNPFRLSKRSNQKANADEHRRSNDAINGGQQSDDKKRTIKNDNLTVKVEVSEGGGDGKGGSKKIFRRSSFKKFLTRIAQQMTTINIGVSLWTISFPHTSAFGFFVIAPMHHKTDLD